MLFLFLGTYRSDMMRTIILFTLLFLRASGLTAQNTVGTQFNLEGSQQGYILFSPRTATDQKFTYLIDNCGQIVNQWSSEFPLFSTDYLLEDGSLYRSVVDDQSGLNLPGNTGRIEHFTWEGEEIWSATISEQDFSFHHDYVILPNNNILLLVAFRMTADQAIQAGRDPLTITTDELYEERIWEITPIGSDDYTIVWEWRSWDHLIQDFDSSKPNFGNISQNPQKVDFNYGVSFGEADWWHSNSISYNPERDQITISNRNLDEFLIIDHSTTTEEASGSTGGNSDMGGDILYRYGNPEAYRQGDPEDKTLDAMHDVYFIPQGSPNAGKIQIFNNQPDLGFSEIKIIDPEFDETTSNYIYNGGAYTAGEISFSYTDPENFFAAFLSGSQELPNGNFLITDGPFGKLFEINPSGDVVWEYISPVSNSEILEDGDDPSVFQRRVYRSLKYPLDYAGFEGRDLTPGNSIELNPVEDNCEVLSINDTTSSITTIFPNPVQNTLSIQSLTPIKRASVYNIEGALIKSSQSSTILVENLSPGIYLIIVQLDNNATESLKFIKQ